MKIELSEKEIKVILIGLNKHRTKNIQKMRSDEKKGKTEFKQIIKKRIDENLIISEKLKQFIKT